MNPRRYPAPPPPKFVRGKEIANELPKRLNPMFRGPTNRLTPAVNGVQFLVPNERGRSEVGRSFFQTDRGAEPVRDWLLSLPKSDRKIIGEDILKMQYCWPIGKPLVGSMGNGLWEVRSRLGDRIGRTLFCVDGQTVVLLHGFIKKTQKTPKHEIDLALKRKNQIA